MKNKKATKAVTETKARNPDAIKADYKLECEKLGDVLFRIRIMQGDVDRAVMRLAQLNQEYAANPKIEGPAQDKQ